MNYNPCTPLKGVPITIMDALSAEGALSTILGPGSGLHNHTISIRTSAAVTGSVQPETAPYTDYTGEWSPLGGSPVDLSTIGGGTVAGVLELQFSNIIINAFRIRVVDAVTGGTVSADYIGQ